MADLTAGHVAELSLWSEPSCQVGGSCAGESGSSLDRGSGLWELWAPRASMQGNQGTHIIISASES